tara:strand:- start:526 stop:900 length:375 start_codon:yes stop_codon:yes gene_type:complete
MGRPVKNLYLGPTGVNAAPTIPVRANIGGTSFEGYVVKQTGARSYYCSNDGNTVQGKAVLVNKLTGLSAGEASVVGVLTGGDAVTILKLTNKIATDFNGNRYTWTSTDDSAESVLRLTLFDATE